MYKEASAGRYGENPFPYGENYDLGISLESVVGTLDGPQELVIDKEYVAIILHNSLGSVLKGASGMVNVVYVPRDNMPGGDASRTVAIRKTVSGIMGVVDDASRVLAVFPITRDGTINNDTTVFENVLTAQNYNATIIEGLTAGTPLYYFSWDPVDKKLDSPVKRCFYEPESVTSGQFFGIGVLVQRFPDGTYGAPFPAVVSKNSVGIYASLDTYSSFGVGEIDEELKIGELKAKWEFSVLNPDHDPSNLGSIHGRIMLSIPRYSYPDKVFPLREIFPLTAVAPGSVFFRGWYDPSKGVFEDGQNGEYEVISNEHYVYSMSSHLSFSALDTHAFIKLSSSTRTNTFSAALYSSMSLEVTSTQPTLGSETVGEDEQIHTLNYAVLRASIAPNGRYVVAEGWLTDDSTVIQNKGILAGRIKALCIEYVTIDYNWLPDGDEDKHVLTWDSNEHKWVSKKPADSELPDGNVDKDVLTWDEDSQEWVPEQPEQGHMPPGEDQNTMFYDEEATPEGGEEGGGEGGDGGEGGEEEQKGAWVANKVLLWQKGKVVSGENKGNRLLFDFESLATRPWDADMPGIAFKHPSGATSGLFANIESGANAGDRLDMGFGGDGGGNFEIYGNDHNTRSGQFRIIVGEDGHVEIKVHQGGTSWKTVAGISKHGRFFCGFNDTGFPGGNETYGTYPAPQHPLQVYDEEEHDSQVVAHITKDGVLKLRAEIGEIERDVTIDLSDISEENEEAISVKLRETYVLEMEDGKLVGKKRMILCSESYGDAEEVGSANIEDGTTGQILRWTDGEWKPTSLVEQNVVTDAEYAVGEFSITTEKLECLVKSGGNATKTVFNTVEGAGKMNTGTTVGHTHN